MTLRDRQQKYYRIFWLFASLILVSLAFWLRLRSNSEKTTFWQVLSEILIFGLLSYALIKFFDRETINNKTRYHTAFLIAAGNSLVLTLVSIFTPSQVGHWGLSLLTIVTSFLLIFIISNQKQGWWENNAPPSGKIEQEVLAWHQASLKPQANSHFGKRLLDIFFALISLILSLPVWLVVIAAIWWEDPGPVLFVKNSVGKGGVNFKQFKFRSMIINAEKDTGPISGYENDERVLFFGKLLRKTALDELPQLINILWGDMSYVGPRPQRTVLVHGYLQRIPDYAQRHQVRPGLAGLAQVVDSYDITPQEKLAWDLVYIQNASIWLDLKLVLAAFYLVFALRWTSDSHAELKIRKLLNFQKPGENHTE